MECIVCGNTNYVVNTEKFPKDFCSYKCYEEWRKRNKPPNCSCEVCGKPMYMKPYRLGRVKNGITCSKECSNKLREEFMSGKNNHQYGLTGDKNSSFGGEELISEFGYILVYCPGHPFPHDKTNKCTRVFKHRLVIEENYQLFDAKYFIEIEGKFYLRPEYVVHHINEIRDDNRLENLQILTVSEHTKLHNLRKEIIRDPSSGIIIGVNKLDNIGESLREENTETDV